MADNMVTLVGSIGNEPELRTTGQGADVVSFRLATNERKRNADGTWSDGATSWFRVTVWDALGRNAHASLHKGQRVVVQGSLRISEFTTESGATTRTAEVKALALGPDLTFGTAVFTRNRPASTQQTPPPAAEQETIRTPEQETPRTGEPVAAGWGTGFADEDSTPF